MQFSENRNQRKSREQKFSEFFETLQLEYIVAELRSIIYPEGSRRDKSLEIMKAKKEKIQDIAIRNQMETIFPDIFLGCNKLFNQKLKERLYSYVYPEFGFPNFIYRDEEHKGQLDWFDFKHYYKRGEEFEVNGVGVGVLQDVNKESDSFYIKFNDEVLTFTSNEIKRVIKIL